MATSWPAEKGCRPCMSEYVTVTVYSPSVGVLVSLAPVMLAV